MKYILLMCIAITSFDLSAQAKKSTQRKNTIGIYMGYAKALFNGYSIENPVNKVGYSAELSYSRALTGLLGAGLYIGRSETKDTANPSLEDRGEEIIHYAQIRLYLKILDIKKHSMRVGAGTGWVRTKRVSGFFINDTGVYSRGVDRSESSGSGISAQLEYLYDISHKTSLGLSGRLISHNDGALSLGLIILQKF